MSNSINSSRIRSFKFIAVMFLATLGLSNTSLAAVSCTSSSAISITSLPYQIMSPGTYCLKSSLYINQPGNNSAYSAITIASSNVTLDLNHWALQGPGYVGSPVDKATGVVVTNNAQDVTVRNGNIQGFLNGVSVVTNTGSNHVRRLTVDGLQIYGTGYAGVLVSLNSYCDDCVINNNSIYGVDANLCQNCGGWSGAYGVRMERSNNITITNNRIIGLVSRGNVVSTGIYLQNGSYALVQGNNVADSVGSATQDTGILGSSFTNMTVNSNRLSYLYRGIWYFYSTGTYSGNSMYGVTIPYTGGTPN